MQLTYGKTQAKNVKALLKLYRKVLFSVNNSLCYLDEEVYVNSRKHLTDLIDPLIEFETPSEKEVFNDKINTYHQSLSLLELLDKTIVKVKNYPVNGSLFYAILSRYYFDNYKYTHDELISILEMSRSNYFRYFEQAIECFYKLLIPLLKSENYNIDDNLIPINYA